MATFCNEDWTLVSAPSSVASFSFSRSSECNKSEKCEEERKDDISSLLLESFTDTSSCSASYLLDDAVVPQEKHFRVSAEELVCRNPALEWIHHDSKFMNFNHNGLEGSNGLGADKPAGDAEYVAGVRVHRPTCIAGAEIERCSWAVCGDDCPPCSDNPKGAEGELMLVYVLFYARDVFATTAGGLAQFLDRVHEPQLPCVLADSMNEPKLPWVSPDKGGDGKVLRMQFESIFSVEHDGYEGTIDNAKDAVDVVNEKTMAEANNCDKKHSANGYRVNADCYFEQCNKDLDLSLRERDGDGDVKHLRQAQSEMGGPCAEECEYGLSHEKIGYELTTSCINVSDSLILQNDMHPEAESGAPAMTALIDNSKRKSKCSLLRNFDSEGEKLSGEHERDCAHRFHRCKEGDCERTDLKEVPDSLDGEPDLTAILDSTSLIEEPHVKGSRTEHDAPYVHRRGSNSADGVGVLPVLNPAECLSDSLLTSTVMDIGEFKAEGKAVMNVGEFKAEGKAVMNVGEFKAEGKADMQRSSRTESGNIFALYKKSTSDDHLVCGGRTANCTVNTIASRIGNECLPKEEESTASMCQEQNRGQQGEKGGTKDQQVSISQIDANRLSGLVSESEDLNQLIMFSTGKSEETDDLHVSVPESKRADDSSMRKIAAACELRMLFAEKHVMDLRKSLASWGECLRDQEREVDFMIMEHCKEYNRLHGMTTELKDRQKCIMSLRRRLAENYQSTDSVDDAHKSVFFKAEDDLESLYSRKCHSKHHGQNLIPVEETLWNRNNVEVVQAELEYEESSLTRQEESVKHIVNGRLEQDRRLSSAVRHLEETQQHVDFLKRRLEFIQAGINSRTRQVPGFSKPRESKRQVERPLTNTLDKAFGYAGNRIASNLRVWVSRATSKQPRNWNPEAKSAENEAIRDGFSSVSFQTLMQTLARLLQRFCRCDGLMKTQTTQAIH